MALFSRRGSGDSQPASTPEPATAAPADAEIVLPDDATQLDSVPNVGITVTRYGASARPAQAARPAPAAEANTTGLIDNIVLQNALAALPERPENLDILHVMRQSLQGPLYVRAKGNAQEQITAGAPLNLAVANYEGKRFLLAYTGAASLRDGAEREGGEATSVVGQPALTVLRTVEANGYDGLYLDHATPGARLILPAELIAKALESADPDAALKTVLVTARTEDSAARAVAAMVRTGAWVAGRAGDDGRMGLAEARGLDGVRRLELYSHPLEVVALGRGDRPLVLTAEQLGKALASDEALTGVVVDPAGPWMEIDRADLAPLLALAG